MKKTVLALSSIAASFVAAAGMGVATPTQDSASLVRAWTGQGEKSGALTPNPVDIDQAKKMEEQIKLANNSTKCCSSGTCDVWQNNCPYPFGSYEYLRYCE